MAFWNFLNKFFFYRRNSDTMATEPFSVYDTHKPGLCIIIANFIDGKSSKSNLDGYVDDINGIKEVFQNKKRFDFEVLDKCEDDKGKTIPFRNLSKDQFEEVLGLIQKKLNKEGKKYGKFVMFVLSHGSEKGIMMYPQDSEEEYQYITDEEIIDHFSHDYVPSLRGVPKCFFFQACRGPEETRASNKDMEMEESEKHIQNHLPIITRANILVAHATLDQKRAYVNHCGSFFLEELIHQLKNEDLNCDIFSLLTKVIDLVSQKEKSQAFTWDSEGIIIEVKGKDGFTPTTLIGKASGKNSVFPLEPSSNQKSYDVCAKPDDYKFSGDIKIIQQGFEMNCTVGDQGVSAGKLDIFANDAFEAEGKLTSKLNPSHSQTGKIKVKDGNILVDGEKPTHGVNVKEMDIMVYETDRQGKLIKEMCRVEELQEKKTRVVIHGYLQGDCSIIKRDGIWKASVKIYQLPVFCSTLTKHLYLTKVGNFFHLNKLN